MIDLKVPNAEMPQVFKCDSKDSMSSIATVANLLSTTEHYNQLVLKTPEVRRLLLCLDDTAKKVKVTITGIPASEISDLNKLRKDPTLTTEYAPTWVIFAVALALGGGTMIGWRRIVQTVGEKLVRKV